MRKILLAVPLLSLTFLSLAQKKAITDTGDEVILYDNGTWKYAKDSVAVKTPIPVNAKPFKKGDNATFLVKSTKAKVGVWLDSKKWTFEKATESDAAEYNFELKGEDLYGMMITERIQVPIESFREIALQNAREASPDMKIIKEEYRTVNGKKILALQMAGTLQGMRFYYYGYYYSDAKGTVQLLAYTSEELFKTLATEAELLLNGLVTIE